MLKVTVDFIPFGIKSLIRNLYEIDIINDGSGTPEAGNYKINILDDTDIKKTTKLKIKKFDRLSDDGALRLLGEVIKKYVKKE